MDVQSAPRAVTEEAEAASGTLKLRRNRCLGPGRPGDGREGSSILGCRAGTSRNNVRSAMAAIERKVLLRWACKPF